LNAIPEDPNPNKALASVIRNVLVPHGISTPDQPSISSTRWRTVFDHQLKLYFCESALTPNTIWVDLKALDFDAQTGKVMKLDPGADQSHTYCGNATTEFKPSKPFQALGI